MVGVRIDYSESALRERVKAAIGIARQRLWEVNWITSASWGYRRESQTTDRPRMHIHLDIPTHMYISTRANFHIASNASGRRIATPISSWAALRRCH
jgi:hypothetical protein